MVLKMASYLSNIRSMVPTWISNILHKGTAKKTKHEFEMSEKSTTTGLVERILSLQERIVKSYGSEGSRKNSLQNLNNSLNVAVRHLRTAHQTQVTLRPLTEITFRLEREAVTSADERLLDTITNRVHTLFREMESLEMESPCSKVFDDAVLVQHTDAPGRSNKLDLNMTASVGTITPAQARTHAEYLKLLKIHSGDYAELPATHVSTLLENPGLKSLAEEVIPTGDSEGGTSFNPRNDNAVDLPRFTSLTLNGQELYNTEKDRKSEVQIQPIYRRFLQTYEGNVKLVENLITLFTQASMSHLLMEVHGRYTNPTLNTLVTGMPGKHVTVRTESNGNRVTILCSCSFRLCSFDGGTPTLMKNIRCTRETSIAIEDLKTGVVNDPMIRETYVLE